MRIEDENSKFLVEKPCRHHPNQVIKVNITSDVMLMSCTLLYDATRRAFDLWGLLPQTHNPNLIMRKPSDKPKLRDSLQNT